MSKSRHERNKHFRPSFRIGSIELTPEEQYGKYFTRAPYHLRVKRARDLVAAGIGGFFPTSYEPGKLSSDIRHDRWMIQFGLKHGIRALGIFDSLVIKHGPSAAAQYGSFTGLLMDIREAIKEKRK